MVSSSFSFCSQTFQGAVDRPRDTACAGDLWVGLRGCFALRDFQLRLQSGHCESELHRVFDRGEFLRTFRVLAQRIDQQRGVFGPLQDHALLRDTEGVLNNVFCFVVITNFQRCFRRLIAFQLLPPLPVRSLRLGLSCSFHLVVLALPLIPRSEFLFIPLGVVIGLLKRRLFPEFCDLCRARGLGQLLLKFLVPTFLLTILLAKIAHPFRRTLGFLVFGRRRFPPNGHGDETLVLVCVIRFGLGVAVLVVGDFFGLVLKFSFRLLCFESIRDGFFVDFLCQFSH